MTKTYLKIGAGVLAASFAAAGCNSDETGNPAYCYNDNGQTVLSGYLGADRGKFIAYYKGMTLAGYEENKISIQDNNAKVESLCSAIAAGQAISLPQPRK